jgi:glutathione S-transferase
VRILYHFRHSPFSRRARLALAHKNLDCDLRDGRENPAWIAEARRLVPQRTMPVLVDEGRAIADSTAITHWLDAAHPGGAKIWPEGEDALDVFRVAALVDVVLNSVVNLGTHFYPLRNHPSWPSVKDEMLGRARDAAEALAGMVAGASSPASSPRATISRGGWSAGDMWLYTMIAWFEGLPARAPSGGNPAQILTLGFSLPSALHKWGDAHRQRADVASLT